MFGVWGVPTGYDAWGGVLNAGWQDTATGYFHVVQHNSVWWLISPAGNPCYYIGLDTGPFDHRQQHAHHPPRMGICRSAAPNRPL